MASLTEKLQFVVKLDAQGAIQGFGKIGDAADKNLKKADTHLDKVGGNLTKFGSVAVAAAGIAAVGLFKAGQSASDLGESVNAVNVTFGKAAKGVLALGEKSAESVGLSNSAFNGLAVQFSSFANTIAGEGGDVVATLDGMTHRAADFASVMNIDVNEAARIFQSGLAGETEPLKKFGIDLSAAAVEAHAYATGIAEAGEKLTESEKVQARYSLLMEQTAKTQGDFANTANSAANAQRIAAAEMENAMASLGASVTPIMAEVAGAIGGVAKAFSIANEATDGWLGKAIGIGTVAIGAVGALSAVAGQVIKMRDNFTTAEGGLTKFGKAAAGAGAALGIFGAAVIGVDIIDNFIGRTGDATDALDAFVVASKGVGGTAPAWNVVVGAFDKLRGGIVETQGTFSQFGDIVSSGADELEIRAKNVGRAFDEILSTSPQDAAQVVAAFNDMEASAAAGNKSAQDWIDSNRLFPGVIDEMTRKTIAAVDAQVAKGEADAQAATDIRMLLGVLGPYTTEITAASTALDEQVGYVTTLDRSQVDFATSVADAAQAQRDQEQAAKDGKDALENLGDSIDEMTTSYDAAAASASNLKSAQDAVFGGVLTLEEANRTYTSGVIGLREEWSKAGKKGDDLKEVQASLAAGFDINTRAGIKNRETVQKQVEAILAMGTATLGAGGTMEEATAKVNLMTQGLKDQLVAAGFTEQQVNDLVAALGLTPENVTTTVELANDEVVKGQIQAIIDDLDVVDAGAVAEIQALVDQGKLPEALAKAQALAALDGKVVNMKVWASINSRNGGRMGQEEGDVHGATGGIVTRPTRALIGEAGPEAVIPLNATPGSSPLPEGFGGVVNNYYLTVNTGADPQQVITAIKKYIRGGGTL